MWAWLAMVAAAMPMRVDSDAADPVRTALTELWPDAEIDLVPVEPVDADHLDWDGTILTLTRGGQAIRGPAPDARTAVLLARSWLEVKAEAPDAWAPDLVAIPDDRGPAAPAGPAPPTGPRSPVWASIGAQLPVAIVVSPAARLSIGATRDRLDGALTLTWAPPSLRVPAVQVTPTLPPPLALADVDSVDAMVTWVSVPHGLSAMASVGASLGAKERVRLPSLSVVDRRPRLGPIVGAGLSIAGPPPVSVRVGMQLRAGYALPLPGQVPGGRLLVGPTWVLDVLLRP